MSRISLMKSFGILGLLGGWQPPHAVPMIDRSATTRPAQAEVARAAPVVPARPAARAGPVEPPEPVPQAREEARTQQFGTSRSGMKELGANDRPRERDARPGRPSKWDDAQNGVGP